MSTATHNLPLTETTAPADQQELADAVRAAHDSRTPLYPLGGETSLDFGLPGKQPGMGLSLAGLNQVVDYPARDMTVTVEAGIGMAALNELLAAQGQWLPVDAPEADRATLGGVVATNASGPRRYGQGTIRDYVIGITAVDGRGTQFHGGGRVVKNVAGYDFCKLLTGSMGTLAVISQLTLKVKPLPRLSALVSCDLASWDDAERLLAAVGRSQTTPSAIELLAGPEWKTDPRLGEQPSASVARLVVGLEGTEPEVEWMVAQLEREWQQQGDLAAPLAVQSLVGEQSSELWRRLAESPADRAAGATLRANMLPGAVVAFCRLALSIHPPTSIHSHAGNGIVDVRFAGLAPHEVAAAVIKRLQPAATAAHGNVVLLSGAGFEMTRQFVWGQARADMIQMTRVKQQFDPRGILNPGRFIFPVL